jgi:hypothetical protein
MHHDVNNAILDGKLLSGPALGKGAGIKGQAEVEQAPPAGGVVGHEKFLEVGQVVVEAVGGEGILAEAAEGGGCEPRRVTPSERI